MNVMRMIPRHGAGKEAMNDKAIGARGGGGGTCAAAELTNGSISFQAIADDGGTGLGLHGALGDGFGHLTS